MEASRFGHCGMYVPDTKEQLLPVGAILLHGYGPVEGKNVIQISRPYRKARRRPELAQPLNTIIRF